VSKIKLPNFVYVLLFASLFLNLFLYFQLRQSNLHLVTGVTDGDTIIIDNNQVLRLFSLNAPEIKYCGGKESKEFLEKLILNQKVSIDNLGYDIFHRTLAVIYLNGKNINEKILFAGMAEYSSDKDLFRDKFQKAATEAESKNLGIYSQCRTKTPDDPKCTIKGIIRRDAKSYVLPGCISSYSRTLIKKDYGDQWFCTEKEAVKNSFKKSTDCR
jgi:endonuclease YncB( thermonuclease family)